MASLMGWFRGLLHWADLSPEWNQRLTDAERDGVWTLELQWQNGKTTDWYEVDLFNLVRPSRGPRQPCM